MNELVGGTGSALVIESGSSATINNSTFYGWGSTTDVNWSTPYVMVSRNSVNSTHTRGIHARLYFKYVKSKMKNLEFFAFKRRMKNLEKMADAFLKGGQEAAADETIKQFLVVSQESAIWACGFKTFVTQEDIDKFKNSCRSSLKITQLKNFARVIPEKSRKAIKKALDRNLFSEIVVLHLDNKESVKDTEKERIEKKEKDPIAFGKIQYSDKFYFITDWEDEFDDLRLDTILKKLALRKKERQISAKV